MKYLFFDIECADGGKATICSFGYVITDENFKILRREDKIEQMRTAKDDFLRAIHKFMEMQTLTPILLRELIEKIEVFPVEGKGKDRTQRIIIYYRFVGRLDIPGIIQRPHFILDSRQGVAIEYLPNAI